MKKSMLIISICLCFILISSFVSANWFGDFLSKITGDAIFVGPYKVYEGKTKDVKIGSNIYNIEVKNVLSSTTAILNVAGTEKEVTKGSIYSVGNLQIKVIDVSSKSDIINKPYVKFSVAETENFNKKSNLPENICTLKGYYCGNIDGSGPIVSCQKIGMNYISDTNLDFGCDSSGMAGCCKENVKKVVSNENQKNEKKYSDKEIFLVSDKDWRDVLSLIPLTTWTGNEDWCNKGYGTAENVCIYPTLIYHEENLTIPVNNLAILSKLETSSQYIINPSSNLIDENRFTRWNSGSSDSAWIKIDFGKTIPFNKIEILESADNYFITLMYSSDGINYQKIIDKKILDIGWNLFNFSLINSRYLKIILEDNPNQHVFPNWKDLSEIKIFNSDSENEIRSNSFDADSIIYFMQQYNTQKVTIVGDTLQELDNLLTYPNDGSDISGAGIKKENIQKISTQDYLSYWNEYNKIIYVEDNYELALMASTYASLINVPLIIQGSELDISKNFTNKNIICIGNLDKNCNEKYNLEELQKKYIEMTKTDKIIFIDTKDINYSVIDKFQPDKSKPIYEIYGKNSLSSPILASAKHEVIFNSNSDNYNTITNNLNQKINTFFPDLFNNKYPTHKVNLKNYTLYIYDINSKMNEIIDISGKNNLFDSFSIYKDNVVFKYSYNHTKIFLYNNLLKNKKEIETPFIHRDKTRPAFPQIFNNTIIYVDYNFNSHYYNLLTNEDKIFSNKWGVSYIDIYDNYIIFVSNGNLYLYNLNTSEEKYLGQVTEGYPSIYKTNIIWVGYNETYDYLENKYLYLYDILTNQKRKIVNNIIGGYDYFGISPKLFEDKIIWTVMEYENIQLFDISKDHQKKVISGNYIRDGFINENNIYWLDKGNIFVYNTNDNSQSLIINSSEYWVDNFKISNGKIVYTSKDYYNLINFKGYLTIISSTIQFKEAFYNSEKLIKRARGTSLDSLYANVNTENDILTNYFVGRIAGITSSDVSSYIARDLFYNNLKKTNDIELMASKTNNKEVNLNDAKDMYKKFSDAGFNVYLDLHKDSDIYYALPLMFKNKTMISYADHGETDFAGILSSEIPYLTSTIIFANGCATCETLGENSESFCLNALRKGAIAYFGFVSPASGGDETFKRIINKIYYSNLDLGNAFARSYYSPQVIFLGDPTFNLNSQYKLKEELK